MKSKISVSIYLAVRITGRTGKEIWDEYYKVAPIYEKYGIKVISPLHGEDIPYNDQLVPNRPGEIGKAIWKSKDKPQIKAANVCVYPGISNGIMREYMLSRGVLWKPSVAVGQGGFIAELEDDKVCTSHEEAALTIAAKWGNLTKRLIWRFSMLNRCLLGFVWSQVREFK